MYKYEMHLHEASCSKCARGIGEEYVDACIEYGYSGFVITDHFYRGNSAIDRSLPWSDFVGKYYESYLRTKKHAESKDIDVLFGIEDGYRRKDAPDDRGKEVLIYGLSAELIMKTPEFKDMFIDEVVKFVKDNGGIAVCAHPFRERSYITSPIIAPKPEWFEFIEVANRANSVKNNVEAQIFAKNNNIKGISGGDVHSRDSFGTSGVAFDKRIQTEKELVDELYLGNYRMIVNSEIV